MASVLKKYQKQGDGQRSNFFLIENKVMASVLKEDQNTPKVPKKPFLHFVAYLCIIGLSLEKSACSETLHFCIVLLKSAFIVFYSLCVLTES